VVAMMVELVQILALSSFYCFINVIIDAASINLPFDIDFIFFFLQLIPILSPILPSFLSSPISSILVLPIISSFTISTPIISTFTLT